MTKRTQAPMGALHPLFFFVLVYGISLLMALFICRSVYYGINGPEPGAEAAVSAAPAAPAVAYQ
ncbi:MAG: hypothetical protein EOO15_17605 [Chitinophagaceae bacterium]|nr:MAG: hypothetical protein EOO15_17605 [Chitinophagaceae bacterium]